MSLIQAQTSNKNSGIKWRLLNSFGQSIREFLSSTVLNGWKYLTFKYLTLWEKLFFICCLAYAFYNSVNFALIIIKNWQTTPVMTYLNPKTTLIANQPFPAITICNMNQVQDSKVKDIDKNSLDYAMLRKVCRQDLNFTTYAHLKQRSEDDNLYNFFIKHAQNCSSMITVCYYGNKEKTCSDLFRENLLEEGLCCSFNLVHPYLLYKGDFKLVRDYTSDDGPLIALDWNTEKGYPTNLPPNFYPRPPDGVGLTNGLTVILNGDFDDFFCSSTLGSGFKISFHNPIDTPNVLETGLTVHLGVETSFRFNPIKEETDEVLRYSTTGKQRLCYFAEEYSLIYFRYYTRRNCEIECDAKFVLRKCNCLPFHMPLISKNATECQVQHFSCLLEAENNFVDENNVACKRECLPNCSSLSADAKAFLTILSNTGFQIKNPYLRNLTKAQLRNFAIVNFYFPKNYYRGSIRTPFMNVAQFVSQVGSVMSLMMGFSVISLIEFVYFFIIKPFIKGWHTIFLKCRSPVEDIRRSNELEMQHQMYRLSHHQHRVRKLYNFSTTAVKSYQIDYVN